MKPTKSLILCLLMSLIGILSAAAQNRKVSGQVLDSMDEPLAGVTVMVSGTTNGGMTDIDGKFTLQVPSSTIELTFTYVGFKTQKIKVAPGTDNLQVVMQEDAVMLEETVVIGYGTQKKVNVTGAVASIGGKELENRVSHSLTNMLQGSVAGLNVTTSSSVPGESAKINVRGTTSINKTNPLVLIDGAEGDLSRVNPNDVESISVIKDASAAAVYGARAAFGVILVTTKSGSEKDGKATVRYSGRVGWEEPTTSTDYINTGYWSVYIVNLFQNATRGTNYINYTDYDMQQLLARVNDKTEHPDRPWVVEETRNGRRQWVYYGNYDWYHTFFSERHPSTQHNVSVSGKTKDVKYYLSGGLDWQKGIIKTNPDIFRKYNLRSKIDFRINKWATMSNNTSYYSSQYEFQGDGSVENTMIYATRHALACFPQKNPDCTWLYSTPYTSYNVANGRHILVGEGSHRNVNRINDFSNTTRLVINPIKQLSITGDFTFRFYQLRNTSRSQNMTYRVYPDEALKSYVTGAGEDRLDESVKTRNYLAYNIYATYNDTFADAHNVTITAGYNNESWKSKDINVAAGNLSSSALDDLKLATGFASDNNYGGGQNQYVLSGIFGRVNYDYKGRYLFEASGRYDGSSRFGRGSRWGFFPSASLGWRISEESFFAGARDIVDNLKIRLSYGSLGNQNVSSYYTFLRLVSIKDFDSFTFGDGTIGKYSSLSAPIADDLTWEKANQYNLGIDYSMLNGRLNFTADAYIRDTKDMLTEGIALPSVYGADVPDMNTADLRTKGYEIALSWRDNFQLFGNPFDYSVGFNLSDYRSEITKYDNPTKSFAKKYYVGMRIGEIWGYRTDGLFKTDEEAAQYAASHTFSSRLTGNLTGGWKAGDLKILDLDGDGFIGETGNETADAPGDRTIIGNSLPSLSYGITGSIRYFGFDVSVFFQGTGNHYWYPENQSMPFWGAYGYPYNSFIPTNFLDNVWAEDNPDAYFIRPRSNMSTGGYLRDANDRYLQNARYLRLKNLTVGYTIPAKVTKKAGIDQVRVYFSGENLHYWSPMKKHTKYVDPEAAIQRGDKTGADANNAFYPWQKTFMFGLDITF